MPIATAAEDIHKYYFHCFSEKKDLMFQALLSSKKVKKLQCLLLQFLFGTLRDKCSGKCQSTLHSSNKREDHVTYLGYFVPVFKLFRHDG